VTLYAGTSGFAYKEWKGTFYPADLPNDDMLGHYAGRLPTVEINNTFYRMPKESVVLSWADQVGDGFRFILKASRKITHFGRLKNIESELSYFLQVSQALGPKRGPSLFQLPPNFKVDLDRLRAFLALLPRDWHAAMEFRHASWFTADVYAALKAHNVALCVADHGGEEEATPFECTADWGYLRLRREAYTMDELAEWARRIGDAGWKDAFVFFKHEDGAVGPALAERFLSLAG
jgi:uncharacterized protein YecE (DUF72 family)